MAVTITSFGYGHAPPPTADITLDVRTTLRNPHHDPALRQMTGRDQAVRQHVLDTPGAQDIIRKLAAEVENLLDDAETVHVAIGCVGGRHRSVVLAEQVAAHIPTAWVEHRDIAKPLLERGH